ncbi:MAG: sodium ion-translocating decarboxylase subunit beta [Lachnospiraceae bacterium]|nr:sodium ion-translocating decarboxylase subunit beta [Lachnospiraceae bacterium]
MKKIAGIIVAVIGIAVMALGLIFKIKGQMSVSVIGGADGPTSIFLAGKIGGNSAVTGMIVGIVLLAVGIFIAARKK